MSRSESALPRYTTTAIVLHWGIALLVLGQFAWGWWMQEIPKQPVGQRVDAFNLHKSCGLVILALMLFRLGWRIGHPPPPLPADAALASHARQCHPCHALRGADRDAGLRLPGFGVQRLPGEVLRRHAAVVGAEERAAQGPR